MGMKMKSHSSGSRFGKRERRRLASLIRKFGIKGARLAFHVEAGRYVSHVTLWRIAKAAGLQPKVGRPKKVKQVTLATIRKALSN